MSAGGAKRGEEKSLCTRDSRRQTPSASFSLSRNRKTRVLMRMYMYISRMYLRLYILRELNLHVCTTYGIRGFYEWRVAETINGYRLCFYKLMFMPTLIFAIFFFFFSRSDTFSLWKLKNYQDHCGIIQVAFTTEYTNCRSLKNDLESWISIYKKSKLTNIVFQTREFVSNSFQFSVCVCVLCMVKRKNTLQVFKLGVFWSQSALYQIHRQFYDELIVIF